MDAYLEFLASPTFTDAPMILQHMMLPWGIMLIITALFWVAYGICSAVGDMWHRAKIERRARARIAAYPTA